MRPPARDMSGLAQPGVSGWFPIVIGVFGLACGLVWTGAVLGATTTGGGARGITLVAAGEAALRLPRSLGDPAQAWPEPARSALPGAAAYWTCQLLVVGGAIAMAAAGWSGWRRLWRRRSGPLGIEADAGFARRCDLRRLAVSAAHPGRLTLGRARGRLISCEPGASLAVVGPSGCGKTAGFAIPALLEWEGPAITTSVKADVLDATLEHRRRRGRVWVYDPSGSTVAAHAAWSPLPACRSWRGAMRVAAWMAEAAQPRMDTVSDGDYWYSQARKGLAPYLHAAAVGEVTVADLVTWIDTQERRAVEEVLRRAVDAPPDGQPRQPSWDALWSASVDICRETLRRADSSSASLADAPIDDWPEALTDEITAVVDAEWRSSVDDTPKRQEAMAPLVAARALWDKEPRLRSSIFATIENVLSGWSDPVVGVASQTDGIDLDNWLAGDNTIYVIAAAHEQARLRPVLTVLIQQAVRAAYDRASACGGSLEHPCLVLLDEAGNTAPLRDLPSYASTARSHGITFVSVWQDLAQVKAAYRDRAQTLLNNHRAKLFGSGIADQETLEYVSRLIGDEHRVERNVSADLQVGRRSVSEHRTYRRAAPIDVLRRVRPGEAVLVYGSELPAHVRLRPWFGDRELRHRARGS